MASYHFEENPYISYAAAPASWRLDDGSAPPEKKLFDNPIYTAENRTFKGTINWQPTFHGDASWDYTMVFGADFSFIESGTVVAKGADGSLIRTDQFGMDKMLRYLLK